MAGFVMGRQTRVNLDSYHTYQKSRATAAHVWNVREHELYLDSTEGIFTVTLPSVVEAQGIPLIARQEASTNTVTFVDPGDAEVAISVTISSITGALQFLSNGAKWAVTVVTV